MEIPKEEVLKEMIRKVIEAVRQDKLSDVESLLSKALEYRKSARLESKYTNEKIGKEAIRASIALGRPELNKFIAKTLGISDMEKGKKYSDLILRAVIIKDPAKVREVLKQTKEDAEKEMDELAAAGDKNFARVAASGAGAGAAAAGSGSGRRNHDIFLDALNYPTPVGGLVFNAIGINNEEILTLILDAGADVHQINFVREFLLMTPLLIAVSQPPYAKSIPLLLQRGANINDEDENGESVLGFAARRSNLDTVKKLVELGADVNVPGGTYYTPVMRAIEANDLDIARYLIEKGAYVHFVADDKFTPLLLAINKKSDTEFLKELVEKGASLKSELNVGDVQGVLGYSVTHIRDPEWISFLIEKGVPLETPRDRNPIILTAVYNSTIPIIKLLLEKGAVITKSASGITPLHAAISKRLPDIAKFLIENGANIEEKTSGWQPLFTAIYYKEDEVANLLLDKGANIDIEVPTTKTTPLMMAAQNGLTDIVKRLLEKAANPNAKTNEGQPVLFWAVNSKNLEITKLLIDAGANFDIPASNKSALSLLEYAIMMSTPEIAKLLIESGANVKIVGANGATPLHSAVRKYYKGIAKLLLKKGADPNAVEKDSWDPSKENTPLSIVLGLASGDAKMAKLLMDYGADPNMVVNQFTVFTTAVDKGEEMVKVFLPKIKDINKTAHPGQETILMRAFSVYANENVIKLLVEAGADVDYVDRLGVSVVRRAKQLNQTNKIPLLIQYSKSPIGALNAAIDAKDEGLIKKALERVKDINEIRYGSTSLIRAITSGLSRSLVEVLLDAGADPDIPEEKNGDTPLMVAAKNDSQNLVKVLLERGADPDALNKNDDTAFDLATDPNVKALLKTEVKKWKGYTKPDMELFKQIIEDEEMLKNISFCPICLNYAVREGGCMYMSHNCKPHARNETLYKLYARPGYSKPIEWCTYCGRSSQKHKHFTYAPPDATVLPPFAPGSAVANTDLFFDRDCVAYGGGGHAEKVKRVYTLIQKACELQKEIGKKDRKEVRDELIADVWRGSQDPSIDAKKLMDEKKFPMPCEFPEGEPTAEESGQFKNIKRPEDEKGLAPIKIAGGGPVGAGGASNYCNVHLEVHSDNRPVFQFRHKQPNGSVYLHGPDEQMCGEAVEELLKAQEVTGKCPFNPDRCKGYLYPEELIGIVSPEVLNWYRRQFNVAMVGAPVFPPLAEPASNAAAGSGQQGGARDLDSIMQAIDPNDLETFCAPPAPRVGGNRRTYRSIKKGRKRTYRR